MCEITLTKRTSSSSDILCSTGNRNCTECCFKTGDQRDKRILSSLAALDFWGKDNVLFNPYTVLSKWDLVLIFLPTVVFLIALMQLTQNKLQWRVQMLRQHESAKRSVTTWIVTECYTWIFVMVMCDVTLTKQTSCSSDISCPSGNKNCTKCCFEAREWQDKRKLVFFCVCWLCRERLFSFSAAYNSFKIAFSIVFVTDRSIPHHHNAINTEISRGDVD